MKQVVFLLSIYGSVTFRILAGYTKWHEGTNEGKKLSYSKNTTIGHLKVEHSAYNELVLRQSIAQYQYQETSENVNQVCSGQVSRLPKQNIGLTCSLLHRQLPYLALGPFQLETLCAAPFVGHVHNFLTAGEIFWFKDFTRGRMKASKATYKDNVHQVTTFRTSKTRFVTDEHGLVWAKVSER